MVGVLLDDIAQAPAIGELVFRRLKVQHDTGAALRLVDSGDFKLALALGAPVHALAGRGAGTAAEHFNLVGNDKGRVEAHTELADQVRIFFLVTGQLLHKVGGAGLGNGAQVGNGGRYRCPRG